MSDNDKHKEPSILLPSGKPAHLLNAYIARDKSNPVLEKLERVITQLQEKYNYRLDKPCAYTPYDLHGGTQAEKLRNDLLLNQLPTETYKIMLHASEAKLVNLLKKGYFSASTTLHKN